MAANKKTGEKKHTFWGSWGLFIAYLLVLCYFLFFAEAMGRTEVSEGYRYNLELFKEIRRFLDHVDTLGFKIVFLNVYGNILAFMPFGFFAHGLFKRCENPFWCTLAGMTFSFCVELCQLLGHIGSFDVDDILLNTLGTILGYLVYLAFRRKKKN